MVLLTLTIVGRSLHFSNASACLTIHWIRWR